MLFKRKSLGEVEEEMITLLDFIDDAFKSYYWLRTRYESVQEFIGNNEKCLSVINVIKDVPSKRNILSSFIFFLV